MKKLLLLSTIALTVTGCVAQTTQQEEEYSEYDGDSISFEYPSDFEIVDDTGLTLGSFRDLEFMVKDSESGSLKSINLTLQYPVTFTVDEYGQNLAQMIDYYTMIPSTHMEPVEINGVKGMLTISEEDDVCGNDMRLWMPIPVDTPWIHEDNDVLELKFTAECPYSNYQHGTQFYQMFENSFMYVEGPQEYDINEDLGIAGGYGEFVEDGYKGYYFYVAPPADFILAEEAEDYAAFISPDGKVVFAIYSPLWYGEGKEIIPQDDEVELDREVKESVVAASEIGPNANRIDTYITVKAKDDSYTRSLVEIVFENEDSRTQRIFSYQYKDQESYDEYLDKYLEFKESLVQYADGRFN